ncbi:MAG: peptide chain release factor N(5)-glutamine methyltransferase [Lachnotalea sp.]
MTLQEALQYGRNYLENNRILDSQIDAWFLLEYIIKQNRSFYLMHQQDELTKEQERLYKEYIEIRGKHIPLQHITQEQEFMGLTFWVNESVLIPRQDTEILVEEVASRLKDNMSILDMCTGSGCIIISLKNGKEYINAYAVDISSKALDVARINAKRNKLEVEFIQSDLFENVNKKFDIIVSNPPYIPTEVINGLMEEVRIHEPMIALDGMADGLYFYKSIIKNSLTYLNPSGILCFEIGYDQGEAVSILMKEAGFKAIQVIKDLAGLDRVVIGNT